MRMQVSRNKVGSNAGKTVALVSSSRLGLLLKSKMGAMGIGICKSARNLGVDFTAGRSRAKRAVQNARWKEAK